MRPRYTMREALERPDLFGAVLPGDSWQGWRALLIAMMGEELTIGERETFTALTGRECEPLEQVDEFWGIIGRRGGKSRAISVLAAYIAALCDHDDALVIGERGLIPILAATKDQAATVFSYICALFAAVPELALACDGEPTSNALTLNNQVTIAVQTASFRSVRSITAVAVIGDEVAFWRSEDSANPDTEILNAVRPALATTGGPLVVISSPYSRRGEVYGTFRHHYGPAGDPLILVARGASRDLNPSLPQRVVDRAMEKDPAAARAEYLGEFRTDVETLLTLEAIDAVTVPGRFELPPLPGIHYFAFVDPSGGSQDSFTLAISHHESDTAVLDLVREWKPPFSPEEVVAEIVGTLKPYGISKVTGDRYGGEWPRERFRKGGITYELTDKFASAIYSEMLPLINGGRTELLDHKRLHAQLVALERKTSRTGKDLISHPPGGHDDIANSAAGALVLAHERQGTIRISEETLMRMRAVNRNHAVTRGRLPARRMGR